MFKVIDKMLVCSNAKALNACFCHYLSLHGFDSIAVTCYQKHIKSGPKIVYDWVTKPLQAWHQHYLENHYADVDRTLEFSQHCNLPVFWDVEQQLLHAKNKKEQRVRQESIAFGIDKGLSFPIHGVNGSFANVVFHQRSHQSCLANWQQKQYIWLSICHAYYSQLMHFLPQSNPAIELTKRELQVMELTAQGLRVEAIAKRLKLSQRTIHFHCQNANKKLGTNNKYLSLLRLSQQSMKI